MAKSKLSSKEQLDELISKLENPIKETIGYLRQLILKTDQLIAEEIKWNSASFYYTGEMEPFDPKTYKRDIVVCNIHRGKIILVFPTGAKVNDQLNGKDYPDGRKIITIEDFADAEAKADELQVLIKEWINLIV
jgi:hypothetical protein